MSRLDRYLVSRVLLGCLLAGALLVPLFSFLDLVEQLEDVGQAAFGVGDALLQVALTLPRRVAQLMPFLALLGTVAVLGELAARHELTALWAAGVSPARVAGAVLRAALMLVALLVVLEQLAAPWLDQRALQARNQALGTDGAPSLGWWLRDRDTILRIGEMRDGRIPADLEIFELADGPRLERHLQAASADLLADGHWRLRQVTVRDFDGKPPRQADSMGWQPLADAAAVARLQRPPESLSLAELWRFAGYLQAADRSAGRYLLVFWQKLAAGLITVGLMLLALPFAVTNPRAGLGARLLAGGVTGLAVYLGAQIAGNLGLLTGLPPAAVALGPAVLVLAVALVALVRLRRPA